MQLKTALKILTMKKTLFFIFLCVSAFNTFSQNNDNSNKGIQINPPDNIINNDIPNQQVALNNMPQVAVQQQAQDINYIQQKQSNLETLEVDPILNIGVKNNVQKSYSTYYSSAGVRAKKHFFKNKFNLQKIHFLRKFRNECPVFKAKTYKKLFTSRKHIIKHCSHF